MAFTMPASWDQLPTKTLHTIMAWFKSSDAHKFTIDGVTKAIANGQAITKAATLPTTQSTMMPTATALTTKTLLPTGIMLPPNAAVTTSTALPTSQSSEVATDFITDINSAILHFLQSVDWAFFGYWLFIILAFASMLSCAKRLYDHRRSIARIPGFLLCLLDYLHSGHLQHLVGPMGHYRLKVQLGNAMHVVGDTDYHINQDVTAQMSRSARRATAAAARRARRTAGKVGRYIPVIVHDRMVQGMRLIQHPFFNNIIVGFTVCYAVSHSEHRLVPNPTSAIGTTSMKLIHGARDVLQGQEHVRSQWYGSFVDIFGAVFGYCNPSPVLSLIAHVLGAVIGWFNTHWLITSILTMLVGVPCAAVAIATWHDHYLTDTSRLRVDQSIDNMKIWFLRIDWPGHRESCSSAASYALVGVQKVCEWRYSSLVWFCDQCAWGFPICIKSIGNGIMWFKIQLDSSPLRKMRRKLDDTVESHKKHVADISSKHTTEVDDLTQQISSKTTQIGELEKSNDFLTTQLGIQRNWNNSGKRGYEEQLTTAWGVAGTSRKKYGKLSIEYTSLEEKHTTRVTWHNGTLRELDEALKQVETTNNQIVTERQSACVEHTQTITGLQQTEQSLRAKSKAKDDRITKVEAEKRTALQAKDVEIQNAKAAMKTCNEQHTSKVQTMQNEIDALKSSQGPSQTNFNAMKNARDAARKDLDGFKGQHKSCSTDKQELQRKNEALKKELDDLKAGQSTDSMDVDGPQAEPDTVKQELSTLKATHQTATELSNKHAAMLAFAAYTARFPHGADVTKENSTTSASRGLHLLRHSIHTQHNHDHKDLKMRDLQDFCNNDPALKREIDALQNPEDNAKSAYNTKQLSLILTRWSKHIGKPLTLGIREKLPGAGKGNKWSIDYDLSLCSTQLSPSTVWIATATPSQQAKQGQASSSSSSSTTSNSGKPIYWALTPAKPSRPPPKTAEQEYTARFSPNGFTLLGSDLDVRISALYAPIDSMQAMLPNLAPLKIPTYEALLEIYNNAATSTTIESSGGRDDNFGPYNLNAVGMNFILRKWGAANGVDLQVAVIKAKSDSPNIGESLFGVRSDVEEIAFAAPEGEVVDGRNCVIVWVVDDARRDPTEDVPTYSDWYGVEPRG
ncbi:MAG: hypothetical protein Q9169_005936 [Polycauliona sp. 2 TL-2023]